MSSSISFCCCSCVIVGWDLLMLVRFFWFRGITFVVAMAVLWLSAVAIAVALIFVFNSVIISW